MYVHTHVASFGPASREDSSFYLALLSHLPLTGGKRSYRGFRALSGFRVQGGFFMPRFKILRAGGAVHVQKVQELTCATERRSRKTFT